MRSRRILVVVAVLATAALTTNSATAQAASPARHNGRIAFVYNGVIQSINQSGGDLQTLTSGHGANQPRWSPDGTKIAYQYGGHIWVMKADGSAKKQITKGSARDVTPGWSPNGKQIVFVRSQNGSLSDRQLFVVAATGGTPTRLAATPGECPFGPTWTSTGTYIVYSDICDPDPDTGSIQKLQLSNDHITTVVGDAGITAPGGPWVYYGTTVDVSPDGQSVIWEANGADDSSDDVRTDLAGGDLVLIYSGGDDCCFLADDPAFSPDGRFIVTTAGDDNPQLDVVDNDGSTDDTDIYEGGDYFPQQADWQPRT